MVKHYLFAAISIVYLMNFTMGIFELPDNLPIIGNLDELAASGLLFYSIKKIKDHKASKKDPNTIDI